MKKFPKKSKFKPSTIPIKMKPKNKQKLAKKAKSNLSIDFK